MLIDTLSCRRGVELRSSVAGLLVLGKVMFAPSSPHYPLLEVHDIAEPTFVGDKQCRLLATALCIPASDVGILGLYCLTQIMSE